MKLAQLNPAEHQNYFEVTANVFDTNTLFTAFQICINIFMGITTKSICREFFN